MPPNRKGAFDAVDSLATLNVSQFVDTAKFQPLTTTTTTGTSTAPTAPIPTAVGISKSSLPVGDTTPTPTLPIEESLTTPLVQNLADQALIERILLEERLREQFSSDHIVQTEEQQRNHEAGKTETTTRNDAASESADDYWAMTTPNDLSKTNVRPPKKADPSYWDWQTQTKEEKKDDLVEAILEQERIRQLFSVDHMVLKIQEQAAELQQKQQQSEANPSPRNDTYWEWNGDHQDQEDVVLVDKEKIIQQILQAEELRQQFSVATLEARLTQEAKVSEEDVASPAIAANDDYWAGF